MPTDKTRPTDVCVDAHIEALPSDAQRADSRALVALMQAATGEPPTMWGPSIVGFGRYRYRYESGREGEAALVSFAARKQELVLYGVVGGAPEQALLERLGRHRVGKGCLYVRKLAEIDLAVLRQLVDRAVEESKGRSRGAAAG